MTAVGLRNLFFLLRMCPWFTTHKIKNCEGIVVLCSPTSTTGLLAFRQGDQIRSSGPHCSSSFQKPSIKPPIWTEDENMKVITANFVTCAVKECKASPASFPLHFHDAELELQELEFQPEFIRNVIPRIDWEGLRVTASEVLLPPRPTEGSN